MAVVHVRLLDTIKAFHSVNHREPVTVVAYVGFLDDSKAFYSVNHLGTGYGNDVCALSRCQ